jgi:holo-[acyl-carrier protein] synthase
MITGVGLDTVHVKRMDKWVGNPKLMERFFHPEEISYVMARGKNAGQSLAVRFAAKEAFGKALGTGLAEITLKDIMVYNEKNGKPALKLYGTARKALEKSGANRVHVSLTHESENAIAMVILEGV